MKDMLRDALTPEDDGRAFTDAVLFRAAGALHRRRAAATASPLEAPVLGWLSRWARPWVIAVLVAVAALEMAPLVVAAPVPEAVGHSLSADAVTALMPEDVAAVTAGY